MTFLFTIVILSILAIFGYRMLWPTVYPSLGRSPDDSTLKDVHRRLRTVARQEAEEICKDESDKVNFNLKYGNTPKESCIYMKTNEILQENLKNSPYRRYWGGSSFW